MILFYTTETYYTIYSHLHKILDSISFIKTMDITNQVQLKMSRHIYVVVQKEECDINPQNFFFFV